MGDPRADLAEQVSALSMQNDALIAELTKQGARVDPSSIIGLRLNTLLDRMVGLPGTETRLRYELAVQETIAEQLAVLREQVSAAAARAILLAPPNGAVANKLITGKG